MPFIELHDSWMLKYLKDELLFSMKNKNSIYRSRLKPERVIKLNDDDHHLNYASILRHQTLKT